MKVTYDPKYDVLYMRFRHAQVMNHPVTEDIVLDIDEEGRLAGIEVLDAKRIIGGLDAFKDVELVEYESVPPSSKPASATP